jgi:secretion/DNA translocation related CpaE-like protein
MELEPTGRVRTVLLSTTDTILRADALRVAAAAECAVHEHDSTVAPSRIDWDDAHAVLIDPATAAQALARRLPRRDGVVVLSRGEPDVEHWRAATSVGARCVLGLPDNEHELIRVLTAQTRGVDGDGGAIAVVGGRGGAGASTLAAALASTSAADGTRTLLVDGDAFGGGLDLLLGWEDMQGLRWPGLAVEGGRVTADALHGALPSSGGLSVLAAGRGTDRIDGRACEAVVDAGRSAGDLVVCDVPRAPGAHGDALLDAADLVVLVVTADIGAVASAETVAAHIGARNSNVGVVVRGPSPGGIRGADVAGTLGLPLLATMRPEPNLAQRVERGGLLLGRRSPLRDAAVDVLTTFGRRPRHGRRSA